MPRRGAIAAVLTTVALVLLINFKTPDPPTGSRTALGATDRSSAARPPAAAPSTPRPGGSAAALPSPSQPPGGQGDSSAPIVGPVIDTRYGPVQLQVTVSGSRIVDVQALQLPTDRALSARISEFVAPILRNEALHAQSPQIDIISGATYTSEGYAESLQAILDRAGG
jgi:hypothetical protein